MNQTLLTSCIESLTDVFSRRIFELVGYDEFKEGHDDGLQVLRYNKTKAYVQHMDYLQDNSGEQLFVSHSRVISSFLSTGVSSLLIPP